MFRTRFAPSPTGYLHTGTAFSALTVFAAAKYNSGDMLLRIEDIDFTRCRPDFEAAMIEDLKWLGLAWPEPVRRQSDCMVDYAAALQSLVVRGLAYRCFRTRREVMAEIASAPHLAADGPEGPVFTGAALPTAEEQSRLDNGEPFAWRLSLTEARSQLGQAWDDLTFTEQRGPELQAVTCKATPEIFGDVIIARKDIGTSYHLASVHDDALQQITHIIRGTDLAAAAHLHRLLQVLLDVPEPVYRHHRLLTDDAGKKLSKRDLSPAIRDLRNEGMSAADLRRSLGFADD